MKKFLNKVLMFDLKSHIYAKRFNQAVALYEGLKNKDFCMRYSTPTKLENAFAQVKILLEKSGKNLADLQTNEVEFNKLRFDMVTYKKIIISRAKKEPLI